MELLKNSFFITNYRHNFLKFFLVNFNQNNLNQDVCFLNDLINDILLCLENCFRI